MNTKWLWKPVLVGATVFAGIACLIVGWFAIALPGNPSDIIDLSIRLLPIGGSIGAACGALFALIQKRIRKDRESINHSQ